MGLRELAKAKTVDGSNWLYPQVRIDLKALKDKQAGELFHVEQKVAYAEAESDSLKLDLLVAKATQNTKWYKSSEVSFFAGAAVAILSGWALGQAAGR